MKNLLYILLTIFTGSLLYSYFSLGLEFVFKLNFMILIFLLINLILIKIFNNGKLLLIPKLGIISLLIIIISYFSIYYKIIKSFDYKPINRDYDYLIVLGAGLEGDKPSLRLKLRLDKTLEYLKFDKKVRIILSGGQGKDELITEALAMENYLIKNGVNKDRIIKEEKSTSTYTNFLYSYKIIDKLKIKNPKVLIITSDYHCGRSLMIGKGFNKNTYILSSDSPKLVRQNGLFREVLAIIKDYILLKSGKNS